MKTISQVYKINASVDKVWQALIDPKLIDLWGGGPVKMSQKENAKFSLWDGDIWGKNIKVKKNKQLVQEWYSGDWKKPSMATFNLKKVKDGAELTLIHKDIPSGEVKDISDGWKQYYLGPLKELVENNT